jgi:hypothetical protein
MRARPRAIRSSCVCLLDAVNLDYDATGGRCWAKASFVEHQKFAYQRHTQSRASMEDGMTGSLMQVLHFESRHLLPQQSEWIPLLNRYLLGLTLETERIHTYLVPFAEHICFIRLNIEALALGLIAKAGSKT